MADLALLEGKPEPATILAAAAQRLSEELGGTPPIESVGIAHPLERARAELTPERYDAAVARAARLRSTRSSSLRWRWRPAPSTESVRPSTLEAAVGGALMCRLRPESLRT